MERPRYDGQLQMFVEAPREPSLAGLKFLRWLAERGRLEHELAGPSSGPVAVALGMAKEPTPDATLRNRVFHKDEGV